MPACWLFLTYKSNAGGINGNGQGRPILLGLKQRRGEQKETADDSRGEECFRVAR